MSTQLIPLGQIKIIRVTGKDRQGKRFTMETSSLHHALCINIWNGSVWAVMESGKKSLIKRVKN